MKEKWTLQTWIWAKPIRPLLIAGIFYMPSFWIAYRKLTFDHKCAQTFGQLDDKYIRSTSLFMTKYSVNYSYEVSDVAYRGHDHKVSGKPISQISPVFYDPDDPTKSQLERGRWRCWGLGGVLWILTGIIGSISIINRDLRINNRKLQRSNFINN